MKIRNGVTESRTINELQLPGGERNENIDLHNPIDAGKLSCHYNDRGYSADGGNDAQICGEVQERSSMHF